jgi:cytochrome c biogenesis protein CcdA
LTPRYPYLAAGEQGRRQVVEFTLAVFIVYLLGGVVIALGPGQLVLSAFPRPHRSAAHILEIIAGVAMLGVAGFLWSRRHRLAQRESPATNPDGRSSAILGAAITAVELPTAFPYFAAIAAIVGSGIGTTRQIALLLLFDVCFVLPLIGIVIILTVSRDAAVPALARARDRLRTQWPMVLAGVAFLAGVFVVTLGVTGLAIHTPFGRFVRNRLLLRHLG